MNRKDPASNPHKMNIKSMSDRICINMRLKTKNNEVQNMPSQIRIYSVIKGDLHHILSTRYMYNTHEILRLNDEQDNSHVKSLYIDE